MPLQSLGGKFRECAEDLIEAVSGSKPPSDLSTSLIENMVHEIVSPSGNIKDEFAYFALDQALTAPDTDEKELSREEMETIIKRHFEL